MLQVCIIFLVFIFAGVYLSNPVSPLLSGDLIVVLGGGTGGRLDKGAELFNHGLSNTVLVTGFVGRQGETEPLYAEWRNYYLVEKGIPSGSILNNSASKSTCQESVLVRNLMLEQGWDTVVVVSDPPHMRRLSWLMDWAFKGTDLQYSLVSSQPGWWDAWQWWENSTSAQFVILEIIKVGYHLFGGYAECYD